MLDVLTNPVSASNRQIQDWWIISDACHDCADPRSAGWVNDRSVLDTPIVNQTKKIDELTDMYRNCSLVLTLCSPPSA